MTEPEALPRGTETLLIVDDQETVWDFLIEALQNLGYSVLLAENGEDAVAIYRDNPSQIDLWKNFSKALRASVETFFSAMP